MPISLILLLALVVCVGLQTYAYAYPTSIKPVVPAKWADLYFSLCISNNGDSKYEKLFIDAVETWNSVWPHFNHTVIEDHNGCDIDLNLLKYPVGFIKERGSYGTTTIEYLEQRGTTTSVDIVIPTQTKQEIYEGPYCCREVIENISEKRFYLTALHEFGHALGVGHAEDTGDRSFDIMSIHLYERSQYIISSVTIKALDDLYRTSTERSDHALKMKDGVEFEVETDRAQYVSGDTVKVYGKVSKLAGTGRIMLSKLDPQVSIDLLLHSSNYLLDICHPKFCFSFEPNNDSSFNVDIDIDKSGRWALLVQYFDVVKILVVDVEDSPIAQHVSDAVTSLQLNAWQRVELERAYSNMDDLTSTQKRVLAMVLAGTRT